MNTFLYQVVWLMYQSTNVYVEDSAAAVAWKRLEQDQLASPMIPHNAVIAV